MRMRLGNCKGIDEGIDGVEERMNGERRRITLHNGLTWSNLSNGRKGIMVYLTVPEADGASRKRRAI